MISAEFLHYSAAIISIALGAVGAGIGLGIAAFGVQDAMTRQPTGNLQIFRSMIIGLALIESGVIVALVISLLTLFSGNENLTWEFAFAELGISLAVGAAAASISVASGFVVKASAGAIARQPLFAGKILTFMLISQSIIEAPAIFAFIIALLVRSQLSSTMAFSQALTFFASTLAIALGCIGPSIGQAIFGHAACQSIGINKNAYNKLFPYAILTEAIIETPMIFCVFLSLLMIYTPAADSASLLTAIKHLIAACTLGIGALGSAIGIGYVGSKSCHQIALEPVVYANIVRTTLLAVAFIESSLIYALIIAMLLIMQMH